MHLDTRLNIERWFFAALLTALAAGSMVQAQDPGLQAAQRICTGCHEFERAISLRQDREGWKTTINKMLSLGADGSEQDFALTLEYLASQYPAEAAPRLNINKASAIELESRLSLKRSEAAAVIAYRVKNGPFKSIDDLKRVPGIDAAKIDAKKDTLTF